jgi:CBS domain-containing protein
MNRGTIHLLVVILHDVKRLPEMLQAWQEVGVPGATILRSAGAYRVATWLSRVGLGALDRLFESEAAGQRTLLAAIEDDDLLSRAIGEAERVMGGFDRPDSGLLLVLPVAQVCGLHKVQSQPASAALPPALQPQWYLQRDTPLKQVLPRLLQEPILVRRSAPLDEVAQAMARRPDIHLACVVSEEASLEEGRLVGLLELRALADDLFFHIMPEEFLSGITDLEEMMEYARRSGVRTAGDAMQEPVWVKRTDTVKDAFKRMHKDQLPGLPVVDDQYHVVGYINLLGLLSYCLDRLEPSEDARCGEESE